MKKIIIVLIAFVLNVQFLYGENISETVQFNRLVEFKSNVITIDSKQKIKPKCYKDKKEKFAFAMLEMSHDIKIPIYCEHDYLGGIYLEIQSKKVSDKITLSQQESDGGELWDTRSWIRKKNGVIEILNITLGSYQTDEGIISDKRDCVVSYKAYQWDDQLKRFKALKKQLNKNTWASKFDSPIYVEDICLNKKGQWKNG